MGDLIQFPSEPCSRGKERCDQQLDAWGHREFPIDSTPEEVLTEFLREAREDQFVFLSIAVYRKDGSYAHVELGLADPEEDPPVEPV